MTLLLFFVLAFLPAETHIKNCKDLFRRAELRQALFQCRYAITDEPKTRRERRNNRIAQQLIAYMLKYEQILDDPNYFKESEEHNDIQRRRNN